MTLDLDSLLSNLKFFPHDVISGKYAKIGDKFTANFMGFKTKFQVTEVHDGFVMAKAL